MSRAIGSDFSNADVVVASGTRTPIGKLGGSLRSLSATDLGGVAIQAALERANVAPDAVDYVVMGHVIQAGCGQITARQAAVSAGIPMTTPANTVNKVCLSGMNAIYLAAQMVRDGDAEVIVAGGMESMSQAPYLLPGARSGYRYGDATAVDSVSHDGLFCAFDHCLMGEGTEVHAAERQLPRSAMDDYAAMSHQRAALADKDGLRADEVVPVEVPQRRGDPVVVTQDEGVRADVDAESLGRLRPAFADGGNLTAGNASQLSDGASAMVICTRAKAAELGVTPLGKIEAYGMVSGPDTSLLSQPSRAIQAATNKAGIELSNIHLYELNEAFAAVALASMDDLGIDPSVTNINGGAIAVGHPLGMSGNRITLTLLDALRRRGGGQGAAALCGGGGQGDAIVVSVEG